MMKKIKCIKCGLRYKDRGEDDHDKGSGFVRDLCWNCGIVWKYLGLCLQGIGSDKLNRRITVRLEDVHIQKISK